MLMKQDMKTTAVTKLLKQIKVQDDFNNWVFELTWGIISRHDQKQVQQQVLSFVAPQEEPHLKSDQCRGSWQDHSPSHHLQTTILLSC